MDLGSKVMLHSTCFINISIVYVVSARIHCTVPAARLTRYQRNVSLVVLLLALLEFAALSLCRDTGVSKIAPLKYTSDGLLVLS